mmetsp:Transcript_15664/g.61194  ORF Transcript_15664/g.61194 Transcript_15664/m.61194 type:complete len:216 (-) Transcript_15664:382-1029(-)
MCVRFDDHFWVELDALEQLAHLQAVLLVDGLCQGRSRGGVDGRGRGDHVVCHRHIHLVRSRSCLVGSAERQRPAPGVRLLCLTLHCHLRSLCLDGLHHGGKHRFHHLGVLAHTVGVPGLVLRLEARVEYRESDRRLLMLQCLEEALHRTLAGCEEACVWLPGALAHVTSDYDLARSAAKVWERCIGGEEGPEKVRLEQLLGDDQLADAGERPLHP